MTTPHRLTDAPAWQSWLNTLPAYAGVAELAPSAENWLNPFVWPSQDAAEAAAAALAHWRRGDQAAAREAAIAALIEVTEPAREPLEILYRPVTAEDVSRQRF
jgi:hypothetical protein